jgi:hypothetical protein
MPLNFPRFSIDDSGSTNKKNKWKVPSDEIMEVQDKV